MLDIIVKCQEDKEPDSVANLMKIKIVIYIDALINFLSEMRLSKKVNLHNKAFSQITQKVETSIRKHFSQPDSLKM